MFIWVHATSSTWQNRTISVSSYVATSKPWAAPPFSPQLSGMSTWPTRKSSTFMVGPRRSRSIFQGLRRFQFHCQSRHYGGQQNQKVRTVRWSSQSLNASTITSLWLRKGSQTSVFQSLGQIEGERGGGSLLMTQLRFVLLELASQKTIICPVLKEKYGDRITSIFMASHHQDYLCWSRDSLWCHRDWESWLSLPLVKLRGTGTVWCTV